MSSVERAAERSSGCAGDYSGSSFAQDSGMAAIRGDSQMPTDRLIPAFIVGAAAAAWLWRARTGARRKDEFRGSSVLITGGSRGLGLALAREFAAAGASLTITARDAQAL